MKQTVGEEGSTDKKRKRGRPKKNVVLEVSPNSRSAKVGEKRGRGRPKGNAKVEESDDEDMVISTTRRTSKRADARRSATLKHNQQSSESECESESDSGAIIEKKRRGRPRIYKKEQKKPRVTTKKKKKKKTSRPLPKVVRKFDEESEISTDSNSTSSDSELERELQRKSETDSDVPLKLPKAQPDTNGEGGVRRRGRKKGQKNRVYPLSEEESDGEERYEVEKIRGEKIEIGCHYFLVKWKNWPECDNSWERAANVTCVQLIENFRSLCRSRVPSEPASSSTDTSMIEEKSKTNDESNVEEIPTIIEQ